MERALEGVPPHPAPRADLEQYQTPASLAAPLLAEASALGDVAGKHVLDLGCGTGTLALAAALLGAARVTGVDVDEASLAIARQQAERLRVADRAEWHAADVADWRGRADAVVMNPPFGAQRRHADRPFLAAALRAADVVYTLHNASTRAFVEEHARERGFRATHAWRLLFPLRHQYRHHEKAVQEVEVVALRLVRETLSRESTEDVTQ